MSKIPVTVLILTKNEEKGIGHCLDNLNKFDEIIVVDSCSTDRTVEVAQNNGAKVENFIWNGQYPKKKQWMLDNIRTKHDWILYMDADETPSHMLTVEIENLCLEKGSPHAAYDIPVEYVFAGRTLKHGHTVVKRALVNRHRVRFPVIDDLGAPGIGEVEGHYQPAPINAKHKVGRLQQRIRHDDKDEVRTWFDRHNKYSDWEAYLRTRPETRLQTKKARSFQGRLFENVPFKPIAFFLYSYFIRRGYVDGRAGFDYAFALSTYYWQIDLKVREIRGWKK